MRDFSVSVLSKDYTIKPLLIRIDVDFRCNIFI
uniref:Uncharacterized protein n=1 Tax=Siphoviridae sp. ctRuT6 TaxID=2826339 RepID=A0A8S5N3Z2_9CAUD|nr:MAG TPA: hypothetical protein [Siphoviridae sp. ctRuT6]